MKLTEKSQSVLDYVKAAGGRVSIDELCNATGRTARSINANVNDLVCKKGLATREKEEVEGSDKPITYIVLNEAGMNFVPGEDEE